MKVNKQIWDPKQMTNLPDREGFLFFIFSICCSQKSNDRCKITTNLVKIALGNQKPPKKFHKKLSPNDATDGSHNCAI